MYLTLSEINTLAFGISNNPEGLPLDQNYQPLTVAYALYVKKLDKMPRLRFKRMKDILVQSSASGTDISKLGTKKNDNFNDFVTPFDVYPTDAVGDVIKEDQEVFAIENPRSSEKGYYCTDAKIYFTGFESGSWFRVRYFPELLPFNSTNYDLTKVKLFIIQKHLPLWVKFLNSIQANIEEEEIPIPQLEFEFDKYFTHDQMELEEKEYKISVDTDNME